MNFCQQGVATAKLALQVLRTPEALELTIDHHCQPGAQGLTLLHAGEGKHYLQGVSIRFLLFHAHTVHNILNFTLIASGRRCALNSM